MGLATICAPFVGDSVGGSHISSLAFLRNIDPKRFKLTVVVHRPGPLSAFLDDAGFSHVTLPLPRAIGESRRGTGHFADALSASRRIATWLRIERPDVVYTNDLRMHLSWGASARLTGIPHVWHQRTRWPDSRLVHILGLLPSQTLTVSNYCLETMPTRIRLRSTLLRDPVSAAATDRAQARAALVQELGISPSRRIVGFIGALTAQKRPGLFIDMAARLARDGRARYAFIIAGKDSGLLAQCRAQIKDHGLAGDVFMLGYRSPIDPLIAGFDTLVAPAVDEAFGRTLVEAMLLGTPVVASRSGGHIETIMNDETGVLFPPDDVGAAAQVVAALFQDPDRRQRTVQRAQQVMADRHDTQRHVTAMQEILAEVVRHG